MSKLEVLVTTMHQPGFDKYIEMNLQTDAVIANQADRNDSVTQEINGKYVQLVTTDTRGVSRNRNIAISHITPETEYVLFSDDDLRFYDGYEEKILAEFSRHPEADAIKFNLNSVSERKISMRSIQQFRRVSRHEVGSWGVWALAIRTDCLKKLGIRFNERFGPGTENYCGEDTIFLQELFKKNVKVYASPVYVADIDQSSSSWFEGYTSRYFLTNGMILQEIYPGLCYLLAIRSAWRFSKRENKENLRFLEIFCLYYKGINKNRQERKLFRK